MSYIYADNHSVYPSKNTIVTILEHVIDPSKFEIDFLHQLDISNILELKGQVLTLIRLV